MFMPRKIKKFIKLLRGQVSPLLAGLSVGLGLWFGLMPSFYGVHALLLLALLILNTPIGLFILFAGLGKALGLAIAPVLFHTGNFVNGKLPALVGLFEQIPIAGMTDFGHPALLGGLLLGPVAGVVAGFLFGQMILGFRKTWLKLEENKEKFNHWYNKGWVKLLDRIVIGKRDAKNAKQALEAKVKLVRKAGIALAAMLLVILLVISFLFQKQYVRDKAATKLSQANGATVDIEELSLSPFSGSVKVAGLGVADRDNLNQNSVAIGEVSAKANVYQMSLGKLVMDKVKVSEVAFDQARSTPAVIVEKPAEETAGEPETSAAESADAGIIPDVNAADLERYFEKVESLKAWLEKIKPWLPSGDKEEPAPVKPAKYLEYLTAKGGPEKAVRLWAKEVLLEKVGLSDSHFGTSNITLTNLNDAPMAAGLPMGVDVQSEQGANLKLQMHFDDPSKPGRVTGTFECFDLGKLQQSLKQGNPVQFEQGKAGGEIDGFVTQEAIDLTFKATLSELQASANGGLFGLDAQTTQKAFEVLKDLDATITLRGPLTKPKLGIKAPNLKQQIVDASKQQILDKVNDQIQDKAPDEVKELLKDDKFRQGLDGLLKGRKD
jgi:uncharacterized protein (TIGR03546 family)